MLIPRMPTSAYGSDLERRVAEVGNDLGLTFNRLLDSLPGAPHTSPQRLATLLSQTIVMTSRLLKAISNSDPIAIAHYIPGPGPLRRLIGAAHKQGAPSGVANSAERAVDEFEKLIREEAGDRSSLGAIISAWLPEAQAEFKLRRKQSAFKAMSELRGASCEMNFSTIILSPSDEGQLVDIVSTQGMMGFHRMRPDGRARFSTRRMSNKDGERRPTNLNGTPVDGIDSVRLDQFCTRKPAHLDAHPCGHTVHYTLSGPDFGPKSSSDLVIAEVNMGEALPIGTSQRPYFFHTIDVPTRKVQFDLIVHRELFGGAEPELVLFDTGPSGIASVNDRTRDIDRITTDQRPQNLGAGLAKLRTTDIPNYTELIYHVFQNLKWEPSEFECYRFRSDFPVIGTQICLTYDAK